MSVRLLYKFTRKTQLVQNSCLNTSVLQ